MTNPDRDHAILAAWQETLQCCGQRSAVLAPDGKTLRTFAEIEAEADETARCLDGIPPRSVVALQLGNSPRWPAALLALFRRELIPLPLGRHAERPELDLAMGVCGARALVEIQDQRLQIHPQSGHRLVPSPDADLLKLTSGTTALPRGIRFRAHQLLADCEHICATMGIEAGDVNFGVIPFSHSYGFSNLILPLLCRGVALVASEDRLPRAILHDLAGTGATVFPATPLIYQKLVELEDVTTLPKLRLCISAGAPLPVSVGERFTARFGLKIHVFYGSSECGGIGYDSAPEARYEEGYVGTPLAGVSVEHEEGEGAGSIVVRSAAVGEGYFPGEEPAILGGGRFIPGDLLRRTERGMVLAGRASDVINIAGRKLNPLEVEAWLSELPGVKQAIVFGVASRLRGEEPIACVAGEGLDAEAVLRHCQLRLSPWQMPRDIWIVPEIPANERGKISRRTLAELYLARRNNFF
ncbi:MAG: acyl--CoA ligase [Verrucomicrobiota bacterium]|nr:acyl--CoA ligase [Verrucomicrobiota bacterium]